jgi:membrane protein
MELVRKSFSAKLKSFATKIGDDNLFLLASSVSYYSALGLAPFLLILLAVASLLGANVQSDIIDYGYEHFSPQVGDMIQMVFANMQDGVNPGSLSGIIGLLTLLFTASLVFVQFRYAFDVIYGHYDFEYRKSTWQSVKERLFSMLVVACGAVLVVASIMVIPIMNHLIGYGDLVPGVAKYAVYVVNFLVYLFLFSLLHYFTPTKRPHPACALKTAVISAAFFFLGNILLTYYLQRFAAASVYGAAGTLLIFLVWAYYSAFTIFLSVEVFQFLRKLGVFR